RDLHSVRYHDVVAALRAIPVSSVVRAALFTALSYAALTGYDALGCRFAGVSIPYPKIALSSFLAYVFSNNIGFGAVTGGLIRYRIYSLFGVSAVETAAIAGFAAVTFWTGLFAIGGMVLILEPLPWQIPVLGLGLRPLGFAMEAVFLAYVGLAIGL